MKSQFDYLTKELASINNTIEMLSTITVPSEGTLFPERRGKLTYYYFRKRGEEKKTYLGTSNSVRVIQCKQDEMQRGLLDALINDRDSISNCLSSLSNCSFENLSHSLSPKYSGIHAEICIDLRLNELVEWANADYEKNAKEYPSSKNVAIDGTWTRSKGETIWYNMLSSSGIPFRFDCILPFTNKMGFSESKAPDFLIQCYDGSFIIIEHLGLLNKDFYSKEFIEKVQLYHTSNFVIGSNFFITCDDFNGGTDSLAIERTLEVVKKRFLDGAPESVKMLF